MLLRKEFCNTCDVKKNRLNLFVTWILLRKDFYNTDDVAEKLQGGRGTQPMVGLNSDLTAAWAAELYM